MIAVEQEIVDNLRAAKVIESSPGRIWEPLPSGNGNSVGAVLVCLVFYKSTEATNFIANMGRR